MKKTYKKLSVVHVDSKLRKEREMVRYKSTGDLIRAGLMKTIDSPLLHTIVDDMSEDRVPPMKGRGFDRSTLGYVEPEEEKGEKTD